MAAAPAQTPLTVTRVATGFDKPVFLTSPPGDEDRIFVVEKDGAIKILIDGQVLPRPFLDLRANVSSMADQGLLGFAFHPDYAGNGLFFVNYTRVPDGATMIERYAVSVDPDVADPNSGTVVIGPIAQPANIHNGACLQFGPDGYLYVAMADGGRQGDPDCYAQNPQSLLGKMLRLDVDVVSGYAVPPSNPFVGNPAVADEIWSLGWRNPWRFSFDRATGDLYAGEVGYQDREEINFEPAGTGGRNYGWKVMEGELCFSTSGCNFGGVPACNASALTRPIFSYATSSNCAVIGGYVYRGCAIPDLRGEYFFADHCSSRFWSFRVQNGAVTGFRDRTADLTPPLGQGWVNQVSSFGEDARGELYFVDINDGEVFKVIANTAPTYQDLGYGKVGGNGQQPLLEVCGQLVAGGSAEFILRRAPAGVPASLLVSAANNPTATIWGTIVPVPAMLAAGFVTDPSGRVQFTVTGGTVAATLYAQYVLLDPGASAGVGLSNAIAVHFR